MGFLDEVKRNTPPPPCPCGDCRISYRGCESSCVRYGDWATTKANTSRLIAMVEWMARKSADTQWALNQHSSSVVNIGNGPRLSDSPEANIAAAEAATEETT